MLPELHIVLIRYTLIAKVEQVMTSVMKSILGEEICTMQLEGKWCGTGTEIGEREQNYNFRFQLLFYVQEQMWMWQADVPQFLILQRTKQRTMLEGTVQAKNR